MMYVVRTGDIVTGYSDSHFTLEKNRVFSNHSGQDCGQCIETVTESSSFVRLGNKRSPSLMIRFVHWLRDDYMLNVNTVPDTAIGTLADTFRKLDADIKG